MGEIGDPVPVRSLRVKTRCTRAAADLLAPHTPARPAVDLLAPHTPARPAARINRSTVQRATWWPSGAAAATPARPHTRQKLVACTQRISTNSCASPTARADAVSLWPCNRCWQRTAIRAPTGHDRSARPRRNRPCGCPPRTGHRPLCQGSVPGPLPRRSQTKPRLTNKL
jgi:hypothetical protein